MFEVCKKRYWLFLLLCHSTFLSGAPIHNAMEDNNIGLVKEILKGNPSTVHALNEKKQTPLMLAVLKNLKAVVPDLLKYGSDVNAQDSEGNTALHLATYAGEKDVINNLFKYNASPAIQNNDGQTPLHLAAYACKKDVVILLLKKEISKSIFLTDKKGNNAEAAARSLKCKEIADLINKKSEELLSGLFKRVERGAKERRQEEDLMLSVCRESGSDEKTNKQVQSLLDRGTDPNIVDERGLTPLHWAAHNGKIDTAQTLLKHGADVDSQDYFYSPLHIAAFYGKADNAVEISKLLIAYGANTETRVQCPEEFYKTVSKAVLHNVGKDPLGLAQQRLEDAVMFEERQTAENLIAFYESFFSVMNKLHATAERAQQIVRGDIPLGQLPNHGMYTDNSHTAQSIVSDDYHE